MKFAIKGKNMVSYKKNKHIFVILVFHLQFKFSNFKNPSNASEISHSGDVLHKMGQMKFFESASRENDELFHKIA